MADECLISWGQHTARPGVTDVFSKTQFKSKTSIFFATRGTKLSAIDTAIGDYHTTHTFENYEVIRTRFKAWRDGHGDTSFRDDRRNGSGGMAALSTQLNELNWVQLTPAEHAAMCETKLTAFGALSAEVGLAKAREFAELVTGPFYFDKQTAQKQALEGLFTSELNKIRSAKLHIDKLATHARSCSLGSLLLALGNCRGKYHGDKMAIATQWVSDGSMTIGSSGESKEVRGELARLLVRKPDWRSLDTVLEINKYVAGEAGKKKRKPHSEAPYASSVGGRAVLEYVFQVARSFVPTNRLQWWNYSLFLFGAIVRAHGFGDGNGRTARVMSAGCAMDKCEFMPLTKNQEYYLSQMKSGAVAELPD